MNVALLVKFLNYAFLDVFEKKKFSFEQSKFDARESYSSLFAPKIKRMGENVIKRADCSTVCAMVCSRTASWVSLTKVEGREIESELVQVTLLA